MNLQDVVPKTLGRLYNMLNDQLMTLKKNPDDWTAKHLVESIRDDIRIEREKMLENERKSLINEKENSKT